MINVTLNVNTSLKDDMMNQVHISNRKGSVTLSVFGGGLISSHMDNNDYSDDYEIMSVDMNVCDDLVTNYSVIQRTMVVHTNLWMEKDTEHNHGL